MTTALTSRDVCRMVVDKANADLFRPGETRLAAADRADPFRLWHAIAAVVGLVVCGVVMWFQFVNPYFGWNMVG